MTQKIIYLRPSAVTYLINTLEKRSKQIKKNMSKKIAEDWYDLDDSQVHTKLCLTNLEYNEIDIILSELYK